MNGTTVQPWWMIAARGAIAIVFGVLVLVLPGITLLSLIALFAAYALLAGAVSVFGAIKNKKSRRDDDWWLPYLLGLAGIGAGAVAIIHPGLTALVLVLLIGANALVTGVLDIVSAIRLRKEITGEWLMALSGLASVVFGVLVFLFPGAGALALLWLIGLYAIFTGILLVVLSFRLRGTSRAGSNGQDRRITPDRRISTAH